MRRGRICCWALATALLLPALAHAALRYDREALPGGAVLLVKENRQLPMVRITVSIPAGARHEAPARAGLANLTAALLVRGTKTRSALEVERMNDSLGGGVDVKGKRTRAEAALRVLTRDLDAGVSLLADVLRNPVFPAGEVAKTKRRILGALRQRRERPAHLADRAFRKSLYGETPFGRTAEGEEESLRNLGREEVVRFHKKWYGLRGAVFVFSGDVSLSRARALVLSRFGGWRAGGGEPPEAAAPEAPRKMRVIRVDRPLSQSTVVLGNRSLRRTHPDFYAARVMNHILGGDSFLSRIGGNLRQRRGLVYAAYSYFASNRHAGHWRVVLQTKNRSANAAIGETLREIGRIQAQGVSDQELRDAKDFITGNFASRFGSSARISNYMLAVELLGFSPGYAEEYLQKIRAVTKAQVLAAAKKYVRPEEATLVVVGNLGEAKLSY